MAARCSQPEQLGPWVNWYREASLAGMLRELRPYHALSLIVDVNQAWGNLQWIGQLSQFSMLRACTR